MMTSQQCFDLAGRTVLVTGGGEGIGKIYCEEFRQRSCATRRRNRTGARNAVAVKT
jgi:NAD(P)-dependent dehydrogenase (short-subunit alcohol dehydrogenase family)